MIYWFTGQPCAGKTVLANKLAENFSVNNGMVTKRIDGDDLRTLITNKDYSTKGRIYNVDIAQKLAHYSHSQGEIAIVSLVSPYIDQREEFKELLGTNITEIYVHTSEVRERDHFHVKGYQAPISNFIDLDTTNDGVDESFKKLFNKINQYTLDFPGNK